MKRSLSSIKNKIIQRYNEEGDYLYNQKSTNINILLNRVKLDQQKESQKKILFALATSCGVLLLSVLIF